MAKHFLVATILALSAVAFGCGDDDDSSGDGSGGSGAAGSGAGGMSNAGTSGGGGSGGAQSGTGGTSSGSGGVNAGGGGTSSGTGGANADSGAPEPKDIVATALAAGSFTKLADALTKAGLVEALQGDGPFTVFAPNDAAFAAFEKENPGVLAKLSKDELTAILKYHVIAGAAVKAGDLKNGQLAETLAGPVVAFDLSGDKPKVNDATVISADVEASNGVIHVIDQILMPPGDVVAVAKAAGDFSALLGALDSAGLTDDLQGEGPFTVFAPTDDAFDALDSTPSGDALQNVLLYHVLEGIHGPLDLNDGGVATTLAGSPVLFDLSDGAKIDGAKITMTNVVAKNGVIHVIDKVIVPPENDIVATAIAAGNFTQLAGALTDAMLVDDLQAAGPFTVFAPTDDAFAALDAVPTGDALKNVLLYHVVQGAIGSGDLSDGEVDTLLSGKKLSVEVGDTVKVNDAKVTTANILTKNGVIHVVDKVLVPE